MTPVRILRPALSPVSVAEARDWMRVGPHVVSDVVVQSIIEAVTDRLDGWSGLLGRCLVTQTWRVEVGREDALRLPFPDVRAVTMSVGGAPVTGWTLREEPLGTVLERPASVAVVAGPEGTPLRIDMQVGFGSPAEVPATIRQAILDLCLLWYDDRTADIPPGILAKLAPWRRVGV